ncbi:protein PHLOEM PROTEIN 2-LIKE A2-like [Rhodamnia argentea]|uniref:Protein PHLOEM PROTEIN 2-LIKE A2-like n=1 Tax=Rhodamnia argentea TaxID=178133 RepID=A0A8B8QP56_9MYRT|nr:protein PHLOEM PROTEIN 2-LIKE A2-like [Rhodamnia argentea]
MEVEVPVLRNVFRLEVNGKFGTIALAQMAKYEIASVVTMIDSYYHGDVPVTFTVTLPNGKKEERVKSLRRMPQQRWEHIPICEFVMLPENVGEVTFALNERGGKWKSGLIIEGVSFRPVRDTSQASGYSGDS